MHYCPECGQACYCHGDIDDCVVETEEYSSLHCMHYRRRDCAGEYSEHEEDEPDYFDDDPAAVEPTATPPAPGREEGNAA